MLIKKSETVKIENSDSCTVFEYQFPSEHVSFATSQINGRYPDSGKVSNLECEEMYYVLEGSGVVHSEKGDFEIKAGDVYHFSAKERYYVVGEGLKLAVINAPPWKPEQHKHYES